MEKMTIKDYEKECNVRKIQCIRNTICKDLQERLKFVVWDEGKTDNKIGKLESKICKKLNNGDNEVEKLINEVNSLKKYSEHCHNRRIELFTDMEKKGCKIIDEMTREEILKKANKKIEDEQYHETCMEAFICPKCGSDNVMFFTDHMTQEDGFRCNDCKSGRYHQKGELNNGVKGNKRNT